MTIEECYNQLHGDYADVKKRLMTDRLVEKFMLKFPGDPSMQQFNDAVAAGDYEAAFRAVHTLKGVAANLAFTRLQRVASDLTEQMRGKNCPPDPILYNKVKEECDNVITVLDSYKAFCAS